MNVLNTIDNERGFALVLSLMVMAGMTILAIAIFTTTTTDMYISRNEVDARKAFYLAETGIEEAMGRLNLSSTSTNAAWKLGETSAQKSARLQAKSNSTAAYQTYLDGLSDPVGSFNSSDLNLAGTSGTYTVTAEFAREKAETWFGPYSSTIQNEIVLYGKDFGFLGNGVPSTGFIPVYEITSTGTTTSGSVTQVRAYVTSSSLNTLPPEESILFVEGGIDMSGGGDGVSGKIISSEGSTSIFGCETSGGCYDISSTLGSWNDDDMNDYLGVNINSISSYADHIYSQSGGNTVAYGPNPGDWGVMCDPNDSDSSVVSDHVCDNEADLIFIDNAGNGAAKLNSNTVGRGVLVVTGDLDVAGSLVWEGMIYVMGLLKVNGSNTMWGTFMIDGNDTVGDNPDLGNSNTYDVEISGGLTIEGSQEVAAAVADMVGVPKMVRWLRL